MRKLSLSLMLASSLFMNAVIPQNVQARTLVATKAKVSTEARVAEAFDKFRYDMTVEWDQQDPYFKQYAQRELENALMVLKAEGVSVTDIAAYMEKSILDETSKKEYKNLLATIEKQNLSEEEASVVAMNFMSKKYQNGLGFTSGASRNYRKILIIVGVIIVGVVTCLIIKHKKKKKNSTTSTSTTSDSTTTDSTTTDSSSSSSSDSSSTTCGNETTTTTTTTTSSSSSSESSSTGGNDTGNNGNSGNVNGNNGHGNNDDGVDVSNPGQGHGGPNGETDPSGDVDDEGHGGGSIIGQNNGRGGRG